VNFRAYRETTGTRLRSQNHPSGFRLKNHFRSVSFRFQSIQDGARGRHGSRTASGSWKTPGIHVESADLMMILRKYYNQSILRSIETFHFSAYFSAVWKSTNFTLISTQNAAILRFYVTRYFY